MDNLKIGQQALLGYLPALVIKYILNNKFIFKNEKDFPQYFKFKTVALFADISGFTKLSEAFAKMGRKGPEFLAFSINRYMEQLVEIIGKNGGDIFKFAGDALLVIWPETSDKELEVVSRRAVQCALDIQGKLHDVEISNNKKLSIKIGIGVGDIRILVVGGQLERCEYLCAGEALATACDAESNASKGGQTICSETVYNLISDNVKADEILNDDNGHGHEKSNESMRFYLISELKGDRIPIRADAYLMRTRFSSDKIRSHLKNLKAFAPNAITYYLEIEKETWSKEIRLMTIMFLLLSINLSHTKTDDGLNYIQKIIKKVQRGLYSTRGSLNKFLMDDKGSVILACWGLPPRSSPDDHIRCVFGSLNIINQLKELKKEKCNAYIGITTGTCFTGVCGNIGNRREYSLLGDVVNLSARHMQKAIKYAKENNFENLILVDEKTKDLCQSKIDFKYVTTGELKGFQTEFDFYTPIQVEVESKISRTNPFPLIRTHRNNFLTEEEDSRLSKSKIKSEFRKGMFMVGRKEEMDQFHMYIDMVYKEKANEIMIIKGVTGSGKSLFIRKCLYNYFYNDMYLNKHFKGIEGNPIIFSDFQNPSTISMPFNGIRRILKYIINTILTQINLCKYEKFDIKRNENIYKVDLIGEILIETETEKSLNYIKEVIEIDLSDSVYLLSNENINLNSKDLVINQEVLPNRDELFDNRVLEKTKKDKIINFFTKIVNLYKKICIEKYSPSLPLIFIIEDCHLIDDYTCELIESLLDYDSYLTSFLIICSYQTPISSLISNVNDKISKHNIYDINNIFLGPLFEYEHIFEIVRETLKDRLNIVIEKIEKKIIDLILMKTFRGIPLFIIEVAYNMAINGKYAQFAGNELIKTTELECMEKSIDWSEFPIPFFIEKVVGSLIDSLSVKELILLKIASVIGNVFDIETLDHFNHFNNISTDELLHMLYNLESKEVIEVLYDLNPKCAVFKFSVPFMREILYQRMMIEQKSEIHLSIARKMQQTSFTYRDSDIDLSILKTHLMKSEETIGYYMNKEDDDEYKKNTSTMSISNLKTYYFKEMCNKIMNSESNNDTKVLKSGVLFKKSDKGISWEERFCVITKNKFKYYYYLEDYTLNKQPLGQFNIKDIISVNELGDFSKFQKNNVIHITVNRWFKKDNVKFGRSFFYSSKKREEMMIWITIFNFLCLNNSYEEFSKNFGSIQLPFNVHKPIEKKYKKKFQLQNNVNKKEIISSILSSSTARQSLFHRNFSIQKQKEVNSLDRKISAFKLSHNIAELEPIEKDEDQRSVELKNHMKKTIPLYFILYLSVIQERIFENNLDEINKKMVVGETMKEAETELELIERLPDNRKKESFRLDSQYDFEDDYKKRSNNFKYSVNSIVRINVNSNNDVPIKIVSPQKKILRNSQVAVSDSIVNQNLYKEKSYFKPENSNRGYELNMNTILERNENLIKPIKMDEDEDFSNDENESKGDDENENSDYHNDYENDNEKITFKAKEENKVKTNNNEIKLITTFDINPQTNKNSDELQSSKFNTNTNFNINTTEKIKSQSSMFDAKNKIKKNEFSNDSSININNKSENDSIFINNNENISMTLIKEGKRQGSMSNNKNNNKETDIKNMNISNSLLNNIIVNVDTDKNNESVTKTTYKNEKDKEMHNKLKNLILETSVNENSKEVVNKPKNKKNQELNLIPKPKEESKVNLIKQSNDTDPSQFNLNEIGRSSLFSTFLKKAIFEIDSIEESNNEGVGMRKELHETNNIFNRMNANYDLILNQNNQNQQKSSLFGNLGYSNSINKGSADVSSNSSNIYSKIYKSKYLSKNLSECNEEK